MKLSHRDVTVWDYLITYNLKSEWMIMICEWLDLYIRFMFVQVLSLIL